MSEPGAPKQAAGQARPVVGPAVPDGESFVAAHRAEASALGHRLAGLVDEPEAFLAMLERGLPGLVDPGYRALLESLSPGADATYGVRGPLREAVSGPVRAALRRGSTSSALWLAQRLAVAGHRDLRLYALPAVRISLQEDPEQAWQLLRRMAGRAGDWIEVDALADVWAQGILAEGFRWAELEQLVYSPRTFERRLVGSTLATLPHRVPVARRGELRGVALERALGLLGQLMGDAQTMVQKALSWAIREWSRVDAIATAAFLRTQGALAVAGRDGARAWVIRDSLSHQPASLTGELRTALHGLRRDPQAASTSTAAAHSERFAALIEAHDAVARQGVRYARSRS
jgi:hypothetical protein